MTGQSMEPEWFRFKLKNNELLVHGCSVAVDELKNIEFR